jgi:hypothetical protein
MPLPLYRHALESGQRPDLGINLSVCGSSLMVANTNALQVTGNSALDPWKVVDGTATNHGNVRIIAVPNAYLYMNIWHVAPALTITTGATVRIFGRVPEPVGKDRVWPEDQDAAAYDPVGYVAGGGDGTGMWVPLYVPDASASLIALDNTASAVHNTTPAFSIGFPAFVYLQGVTQVMVLVATAGSAGVVAVSFHG